MSQVSEPLAYPVTRDLRCPFDPAPAVVAVAHSARIHRVKIWDGSKPWLITNYADIRKVMAYSGTSSDTDNPKYPHYSAAVKARRSRVKALNTSDGPEHDEPRRALAREFTAKRMQSLRDQIQRVTDDCIDAMLAGPKPVDLVQALALPVPTAMICDLLGVPASEHRRIHDATTAFVAASSTPEDTVRAADDLMALMGDLIDAKSVDPQEDLLSRLTVEQLLTGQMTREQVARLGVVMVTAGHDTSANMIALGTAALLENPEQAELLRTTDDPAVVAGAVEELFRYLTVVHHGVRRVMVEDLDVGGVTIKAGDGVILQLAVGNRDAEAFPGDRPPEELDLTRPARHHLAFGFGIHQCLGQQLARVELQTVYGTLLRRIPTLALATPLEELPFRTDMSIYGTHELMVTW